MPRILVVDDEPHIALGVRDAMRKRAEVVCAESGAAALTLLAAGPAYEVVLTDLRMPGMDGNELLRRIREHHPDTIRMMWSGQADLVAATEAINSGGIFRFLLKPCNGRALEDALFAAIDEHRRQEQERNAAMEDPLLKIGSRRAFDNAISAAETLVGSGKPVSIAMIDVDEFKKYNDTYGHVAGDIALVTVAGALVKAAEGRARVFRYGGEEMAVVAAAGTEETAAIVEDARRGLEAARVAHAASKLGILTFSSGVASFGAAGASAVECADQALYQSKTTGRNRVTIWG